MGFFQKTGGEGFLQKAEIMMLGTELIIVLGYLVKPHREKIVDLFPTEIPPFSKGGVGGI
jgi:hypothetical protein